MAATLTRLIFFASGDLHAVVNADSDSELAPHKGPPGSIFVDTPRQSYLKSPTLRDQMALGQPLVAAKDSVIGAAITSKIQAIDAAIAAELQAAADAAAAAVVDAQPDAAP